VVEGKDSACDEDGAVRVLRRHLHHTASIAVWRGRLAK